MLAGMADVDLLLDEGVWTLAKSQRTQDDARRLEVETRALILAYRSHRVHPISGGSREVPTRGGEPGAEHRRERLRRLVNSQELPNIYAGYSRGTKTCDCCGRQILRGAHAYEITFSALKFVLDCDCIGVWQDAMLSAILACERQEPVCMPTEKLRGALRILSKGTDDF